MKTFKYEIGMTEEEIRGPRLFNETPPHLGLLGTGFLQKNGTMITLVNKLGTFEKVGHFLRKLGTF